MLLPLLTTRSTRRGGLRTAGREAPTGRGGLACPRMLGWRRRSACPRLLAAVVLLCLAVGAASGQAVIGGEVRLDHSVLRQPELVDTDEDGVLGPGWEYGLRAVLRPILTFGGDYYSFTGSADLSYDLYSESFSADLPELRLDLFPTPWSLIRLGRFRHLTGTAEFFSPTNYMVQTDFEALLTGDQDAYQVPTELVQATVFLGSLFVRATLSPVRPEMILPAVDSPWFPDRDLASVPNPIVLPGFPTPGIYELGDIYYQEQAPSPDTPSKFSYLAELGGNAAGIDFTLSYYDGWQNDPLVTYELFFGADYDIIIRPEYELVRAVGLAAAGSVGPLRLWLDAAYSFDKSFATSRPAAPPPVETELDRVNAFETAVGFSVEMPEIQALWAVEYTGLSLPADADASIVRPYLSQAMGTALSVFFLDYRLAATITGIASLPHEGVGSGVLFTSVSFSPAPDLEAALRAPIFLGDETSELGQFKENTLIAASVTVRF